MIRIRFNRYLECQDPSDISSGDDCNQGLLTEVDSDFYQANYEGSKLRSILRKRQSRISLLSDEDEIVSDVTTTRKPPKMQKKKKSKRLVTQVDGSSGDDEDEDYNIRTFKVEEAISKQWFKCRGILSIISMQRLK